MAKRSGWHGLGEDFQRNTPSERIKIVDPGRFPYGTVDFSFAINTFSGNLIRRCYSARLDHGMETVLPARLFF